MPRCSKLVGRIRLRPWLANSSGLISGVSRWPFVFSLRCSRESSQVHGGYDVCGSLLPSVPEFRRGSVSRLHCFRSLSDSSSQTSIGLIGRDLRPSQKTCLSYRYPGRSISVDVLPESSFNRWIRFMAFRIFH